MNIKASKHINYVFIMIVVLSFCLTLLGCEVKKNKIFKETRPSMHTIVTVTAVTDSEEKAARIFEECFVELDRIASLLNFYSETSELSVINRNAGIAPVKVSQETLELIDRSVYISKMTDGGFDVTVGALVKLWDMRKQIIPDKKAIEEAKKNIGYDNIVIDKTKSTVFIKKQGVSIDLGGIVKGYAADRIVDIMRRGGFEAGIAQVGGEVRTFGKRPDGSPWTVGIQNPRPKGSGDDIIATIDVSDVALSTSGDYNKYFEKDGKRYHHLIDTKTGYPADNCGSATVLAENATTSDGFSKLFIVGHEKGLAIAKKVGIEVIFIDCNGKITMTDGVKERIKFIYK